MTSFLFLAETVGFFRGCRLYRLATLVATVGKNSPLDCFLPLRSLLVRIPYSFHIKKKTSNTLWCCLLFLAESKGFEPSNRL